jgi:hypothetical protein
VPLRTVQSNEFPYPLLTSQRTRSENNNIMLTDVGIDPGREPHLPTGSAEADSSS